MRDDESPTQPGRDAVGMRRYGAIRQLPGAMSLLSAGAFARLGIGMTPLGIVLLLEHATSRYTWAGLAAGTYAFGIVVGGPIHGRLADRTGVPRLLVVTAIAHPIGLTALLVSVHTDAIPAALAAALLAGGTYPPTTGAIRSTWSRLTAADTAHHHLRDPTLAAETAVFELVFVVGPMLNALCLAVATPAVALATSGLITFAGTLAVARHPAMAGRPPARSESARPLFGPLTVPSFGVLLACATTMGAAFGFVSVGIPAYAATHATHRADELAAILLTIWNLGSVAGAFSYGARRWTSPPLRQLAYSLATLAVGTATLAAMPNIAALAAVLVLSGLAVAPTIAIYTTLASRIVPARMLVEAHNWLATLPIGTHAIGLTVAGAIVDRPGGVHWAFAVAGALLAAVTLIVIHHHRTRPG